MRREGRDGSACEGQHHRAQRPGGRQGVPDHHHRDRGRHPGGHFRLVRAAHAIHVHLRQNQARARQEARGALDHLPGHFLYGISAVRLDTRNIETLYPPLKRRYGPTRPPRARGRHR
ncbi:PP189 [Orf virus]|uniref:PP189 n=1 Tax=Orf virus TaxID=10258 RepID=F1AX30_ORFV|nr:PP189 [Orf virus]